jgi:hypothetical protein
VRRRDLTPPLQRCWQVRIKNRFDPAFDAERSAGYRSLAVNLRVVTERTMALGVETHVCEVQLLLVQMAAIKVGWRRSNLAVCLFRSTRDIQHSPIDPSLDLLRSKTHRLSSPSPISNCSTTGLARAALGDEAKSVDCQCDPLRFRRTRTATRSTSSSATCGASDLLDALHLHRGRPEIIP